jgi:hypothetical protein
MNKVEISMNTKAIDAVAKVMDEISEELANGSATVSPKIKAIKPMMVTVTRPDGSVRIFAMPIIEMA